MGNWDKFVSKLSSSWGNARKFIWAESSNPITHNNAANDKVRKPLYRQAKTVSSVGRASMQLAQLDSFNPKLVQL